MTTHKSRLRRRLIQEAGGSLSVSAICVGVWLAAGADTGFWPGWVIGFTLLPLVRDGWRLMGPRRTSRPSRPGCRRAASASSHAGASTGAEPGIAACDGREPAARAPSLVRQRSRHNVRPAPDSGASSERLWLSSCHAGRGRAARDRDRRTIGHMASDLD
jgi:hypothetical protein